MGSDGKRGGDGIGGDGRTDGPIIALSLTQFPSRNSKNATLKHSLSLPEPLDEPPRLLASEAAAAGLSADEFVTLQHGAGITVEAGGALAAEDRGGLLTLPVDGGEGGGGGRKEESAKREEL